MAFSLRGVQYAFLQMLLDSFSRTNHLFSSRQSNNAAMSTYVYCMCFVLTCLCSYVEIYTGHHLSATLFIHCY